MSGSNEIDPAIFDPSMFDINSFNHNNIDPNIFVQSLNLTPEQLAQVKKVIKKLWISVNYKRNDTEFKINDLTESHASLNKMCINECPKCNNMLSMQNQISTLRSQLPNFSAQLRTLEDIENKIEAKIPIATQMAIRAQREAAEVQAKAAAEAEAAEVKAAEAEAAEHISELREQIISFDNNPSREGYNHALQTYYKIRPLLEKLKDETRHQIDDISASIRAMYKVMSEKHEQANQANQANNQFAGKKRIKSKKSSRKTKYRKSNKSRRGLREMFGHHTGSARRAVPWKP